MSYDQVTADVISENKQLREEIATLKAWKDEALVALAEREEHTEALRKLMPPKYWGWHYLEAAVDYIRTLTADAAQVKGRLKRIAEMGPEENARLRKYDFVFNRPIGVPLPDDEAGRFEMLAFTLHSDVWEAASIAQSIIVDDDA